MEENIIQFIFASIAVFAFGIGMFLMGVFSIRKRFEIYKNGEETVATVEDIQKMIGERKYRYKIAYKTVNGEHFIEYWNEYQNIRYCRKHPIGSTMEIKYSLENPSSFIVKKLYRLNLGLIIMMLIGIGLILLSIFIIYSGIQIQLV